MSVIVHVGKFELAMKTEEELKRILCFLSSDSSSTSSLVGSPSHVVPLDGNGANLSGTGNIKNGFFAETTISVLIRALKKTHTSLKYERNSVS